MFTAHCNGCEVSRVGDVSLQPGDHLAVCFMDLTNEQMEVSSTYIDHRSMHDLRSKDYLTLFDCFDAFTDRLHYPLIISDILMRNWSFLGLTY